MDSMMLIGFALIFFLGALLLHLAKRFRLPYTPFMLALAFVLSKFASVTVPDFAIDIIVSLIFPVVIFDVFSRLHIKRFDSIGMHALHASGLFLILSATIIGMVAFTVLDTVTSIFSTILLGIFLLAASDFDIPLRKVSKTIEKFIYDESIISSAIMLTFFFSILSVTMLGFGEGLLSIILGIGIGVISGLIVFRTIRISWNDNISRFTLFITAVACFYLARIVEASPVIAVATMGYFFGNVTIRDRKQLAEFSGTISSSLQALLFLLVPLIIPLRLDWDVLILGLIILMFYVARYLSLKAADHHDFSTMENVFLTLYNPKGTITIAALLYVYLLSPEEFKPLYSVVIFAVYATILITAVVAHYGHSFSKRIG